MFKSAHGASDSSDSSRIISIPLPTNRLAVSALRALQVDAELSPLVRRSFFLRTLNLMEQNGNEANPNGIANSKAHNGIKVQLEAHALEENKTVLRTEYKATTNRMLRVAVNGFMESLGVVLGVMEELDVDVLAESLKVEQI